MKVTYDAAIVLDFWVVQCRWATDRIEGVGVGVVVLFLSLGCRNTLHSSQTRDQRRCRTWCGIAVLFVTLSHLYQREVSGGENREPSPLVTRDSMGELEWRCDGGFEFTRYKIHQAGRVRDIIITERFRYFGFSGVGVGHA